MSTQEASVSGIGDFPAALGPFRAAWDTSPASIIALSGPRHLLVYQNAASLALFGARPLGVPVEQAFCGVLPGTLGELDGVFATGEPVRGDRVRAGIRDLGGGEVNLRYSIAPYGPPGVPPDGVVVTGVDLSGEARAEVASHWARLLVRLTERINAAADPASALRALTEVLVPELADVAAVYVLPDDGESGTGGPRAEPVAPETVAVAAGLARLGPPPTPSVVREHPSRWDELFASGIPVLVPFETEVQGELAADPAARAWLAAAGARNLAVVPLTVAGRLIGALLLVSAGDRRPFTEAIVPFLTDVAARAGSAVVQVRQNRLQAEVSQQLQQALLPAAPPRIPGLRVAARYVAGAPEVDVGGDWWDVVRVDERHVSIGVGDVSGRGVEAAIVMGQARAAMRTAGLAGLGPAQVLGLLDRQVRDL
ncbi:MAG TPA: GAF domain-containing protein, partial [Kineosporiaceae bacterium]|nr:GAF domain-containing protein [Kineosporiaceae bacterium]